MKLFFRLVLISGMLLTYLPALALPPVVTSQCARPTKRFAPPNVIIIKGRWDQNQ